MYPQEEMFIGTNLYLYYDVRHFPGKKSVFSVGLLLFYRVSGNVDCLIGSDPPQPPLKRGAFRLNTTCKNIYIMKSVDA